MKVYSIFVSIDGEINKFYQGCFSTFVRLSGCNIQCVYCDTRYALLPSSGRDMSVNQLIQRVGELGCKKVTITGGEPLLQKDELEQFCIELHRLGYNISIETNGTIIPPQDWHVNWVVDYKLPSSGEFARMRDACFIDLDGDDFVKFVVGGDLDYELAIDVMRRFQNKGCKAKFAFSPLHGRLAPAVLTGWMIKDRLFGCLLNVQLHKYIDLKEDTK